MKKLDLFLEKVITSLSQKKIIKPVFSLDTFNYSDEVKIYRYSVHTRQKSPYFKEQNLPFIKKRVDAGGVSTISRREALLKCVSEYAERFSLYYYDKNKLLYAKYSELPGAVNPKIYKDTSSIAEMTFAWVNAYNFTDNKKAYLPSQLVYLHSFAPDPVKLQVGISTGAASDFNKSKALLRGIYEAVERDAFISAYLVQAKVPRIDLSTIKDERVKNIVLLAKRYNLELQLFDITSDIAIPTYLTVLIDRTGIGPAVLIGTKSSLNRLEAVIGSMEESFMGRAWVRAWMMKGKHLRFNKKNVKIETQLHRALFWSRPEMISRIEYLIRQEKIKFIQEEYKSTIREDLKSVKKILKESGFTIYYADITNTLFKDFGFVVIKTVIPGLQPLYLGENEKEIIEKRLEAAAKKFKVHKLELNPIPHPFL